MTISIPIALCVLLAALMHASWNALLKNASDKFLNTVLIAAVSLPIAIILLPFLPMPHSSSWIYIVLSIGVHIAYFLLLAKAYEHGDLSQSYMIIRGLVPPLVAILSFLLIDEIIKTKAWIGIGLISFGLIFLADFKSRAISSKALTFSLATSFTIVIYTIIDGLGARASGSPISYLLLISAGQATALIGLALTRKKNATILYARTYWKIGSLAGLLALGAYGIVLWAVTHAPIGIVSALRETSVIYATLIGVIFFKEGFGSKRLISALIVCMGAVLIKF